MNLSGSAVERPLARASRSCRSNTLESRAARWFYVHVVFLCFRGDSECCGEGAKDKSKKSVFSYCHARCSQRQGPGTSAGRGLFPVLRSPCPHWLHLGGAGPRWPGQGEGCQPPAHGWVRGAGGLSPLPGSHGSGSQGVSCWLRECPGQGIPVPVSCITFRLAPSHTSLLLQWLFLQGTFWSCKLIQCGLRM